jgi:long-chain fatty acid transport protein
MASLASSEAAYGSGFLIPEQGAKASSMAAAFTATADDPSAVFYNPAGLAQQRRLSGIAGGTFITFKNEFRGDRNDEFTSGQSGFYDAHVFIPPNGYVVVPIGENVTLGVGLFSAFGLRTDWDDPWAGRFVSRDVNLKTASLEPALAWQTGDGRFAVGGGIEYRRARVTLNRNNGTLNPFNGRIVDVANVYLSSDWESSTGWNVGVLFKPSPKWRFGASYRSDMDIDFGGDATFAQIPTGNAQLDAIVRTQIPPNQAISLSLPFPAVTAVGVAVSPVPDWDIEFDVHHTSWSRVETLDILFSQTSAVNLHRDENWKDSVAFRLGANHAVTPEWDIRLGALYDQNPQPAQSVSTLLPDADRQGVTMGLGFHRGIWIIDVGALFLNFSDRGTEGRSNDNFNGTYKTNANLFFTNFGLRF